jgi:hypothetical protein
MKKETAEADKKLEHGALISIHYKWISYPPNGKST